jgi:hypothetical protein
LQDNKEGKESSADDPPTKIPTELNSQSTVVNEAPGHEEENKAQFSSQVLSSYLETNASIVKLKLNL